MDKPGLPRSKLTLWAMSVLSQAVHAVDHRPTEPTARLRLAMAWLAVSAGEAQAIEELWEEARKPMNFGETDHMKRYIRGTAVRTGFERICERMGVDYWTLRHHADANRQEWP